MGPVGAAPAGVAAAGAYLSVLGVLVATSWLTVTAVGVKEPQEVVLSFPGDLLLGGLAGWDSGWYYLIATEGYESHRPDTYSPVAFFPGYPLAMRLVGSVVGHPLLAGIVVTVACGLGSAVLFRRWCQHHMTPAAATTALLVLLLYPYSYYLYGVVYADALFLFSTLAAFTALERDRPLLAGLAGAVAAFSRPVGIAVVLGLVVCLLERRGVLGRDAAPRARPSPGPRSAPGWWRQVRAALHPRDGLVLLALGGLVAYPGFLWTRFGDPLLFSSVQSHWGQDASPRTWFKAEFLQRLVEDTGRGYTWGIAIQGALALAALAAVPLVVRRFGWGYGVYTAVVLAIPVVGSKDFQGLGRYLIAAFPVFALVGLELARRDARLRTALLTMSGTGLLVGIALFSHGYYIA